jgi:hypothetical protein
MRSFWIDIAPYFWLLCSIGYGVGATYVGKNLRSKSALTFLLLMFPLWVLMVEAAGTGSSPADRQNLGLSSMFATVLLWPFVVLASFIAGLWGRR